MSIYHPARTRSVGHRSHRGLCGLPVVIFGGAVNVGISGSAGHSVSKRASIGLPMITGR